MKRSLIKTFIGALFMLFLCMAGVLPGSLKEALAYDLWVGDTQVTDENKDKIPINGSFARYKPETQTLEINGSVIGSHDVGGGKKADIVVYDSINLTIDAPEGDSARLFGDNEYGLYVKNQNMSYKPVITLKGDVRISGSEAAVHMETDGGRIVIEGDCQITGNGVGSKGIYAPNGTVEVNGGNSKIQTINCGPDAIAVESSDFNLNP